MNRVHPTGLFTYGAVEHDAKGRIHYFDCQLLKSIVYDEVCTGSKWQPATFHDDKRCFAGAYLSKITVSADSMIGWVVDDPVLDIVL
jgi:hypothetical protein